MKKEIQKVMINEEINKKKASAFQLLYAKYYKALCSYSAKIIGTREGVEDLVQEIFVAIYEGDHAFESMDELAKYLYRSCYNKSLSYIRDKNLHDSILQGLIENREEEEELIYALSIQEELIRKLYFYMKKLPPRQYHMMLLRIEGYTWIEIADEMGVSINTIKTLKNRSFCFLRKWLQLVFIFF